MATKRAIKRGGSLTPEDYLFFATLVLLLMWVTGIYHSVTSALICSIVTCSAHASLYAPNEPFLPPPAVANIRTKGESAGLPTVGSGTSRPLDEVLQLIFSSTYVEWALPLTFVVPCCSSIRASWNQPEAMRSCRIPYRKRLNEFTSEQPKTCLCNQVNRMNSESNYDSCCGEQ
eukprot:IDg5146t1